MSAALIGQDQTAVLGDVTDGGVPENGAAPVADLKTRVMQGGDFAWEQIQKRDRHSSELANRVKELEPVEQLVKFAGGTPDQLFHLTDLGNRVKQIPGLFEVVQKAIQTGRVEMPHAAPQDDPDDQWVDPDLKKVRDAMQSKIDHLESQVEGFARIASSADVRSKEQRVKGNIEKALKEFEGDQDAFAEASKRIMDRYTAAFQAAERGDQVQARLIEQLSSDDGLEILEVLTMPVYKKYAPKLVAASRTSTTEATQAPGRKTTDAPTVNPSRPVTSPLPPLPKGRVTDKAVHEMFMEIARRKGIDPRVL